MERFLFSYVKTWVLLVLLFAVSLMTALWSYAILRHNVFPHNQILEIKNFMIGHEEDHRSIFNRLSAELNYLPDAFKASNLETLIPDNQLQPVNITENANGTLPDLSAARFYNNTQDKRYYVLYGSFAFVEEQANWGAILIDSEGNVLRGWAFEPEGDFEYSAGNIGFDITEDGVLAANTLGILVGYSWCGERLWQADWSPDADGIRLGHNDIRGYDWHHDITAVDGNFFTFQGPTAVEVSGLSGEVINTYTTLDFLNWAWNEDLSILDHRSIRIFNRDDVTWENIGDYFYAADPFHYNKIDILTEDNADDFEFFQPGDMLLSAREVNLVFVARPSEERIIWWRSGLTSRQHDATFIEGNIEVFDNNPRTNRERIVRFDLDEHQVETIFDFSSWKIQMPSRGNFERHGDRIITVSDNAGRFIAGRLNEDIEFVFENGWGDTENEIVNLQLRNATEIPEDWLVSFERQCQR